MSQTQSKPMTSAEFLVWEAGQDRPWEFDGFQPVAKNGGTWAHSTIERNLLAALHVRLRDKPCKAAGPAMRVPTVEGRFRYPDALVTCNPPVDARSPDIPDPVVIFEILSPSTEHDDKTTKLVEYRSMPSVQRYVMIEQTETLMTVIARTPTGWSIDTLDDTGTLHMPEIGIEVPVSELYEGLVFEPASP